MNLKLIVAILVIAAVPVCAQAQKPSSETKVEVLKLVRIISEDKAKTQTYCDIIKLGDERQQMEELRTKLGPEFVAVGTAAKQIDPNSPDGKEIRSAIGVLVKECAK